MNWIKVNNELPAFTKQVLVQWKEGHHIGINVAYFWQKRENKTGVYYDWILQDSQDEHQIVSGKVTHWQPLPNKA